MNITNGVQDKCLRAVIYGPVGIGKSTLASRWPNPIFLDIEGSTAEMDVARIDAPKSWSELVSIVGGLSRDMRGYSTLVIDTADWAEKLLREHVCSEHGVKALGDKPYGQLYSSCASEWGRLLDTLTRVADLGAHVVILAHSQIVHCEIPEETGAFDRYEMKLLNSFKTSLAAACKEWASLVIFAGYELFVSDKKVQGGRRVLRTTYHPCWDAKQRTGMNLPECIEFFADKIPPELARLFEKKKEVAKPKIAPKPESKTPVIVDDVPSDLMPAQPAQVAKIDEQIDPGKDLIDQLQNLKEDLINQLRNLMTVDSVSLDELNSLLVFRGIIPTGMHPKNYNAATLTRVITNWDAVKSNIMARR